ncbi:unnamed protein product [Cuscuta campestris]|uniref:Uncharacterized protein n=1 Tax=Cuscuta campestris TaxID=132261 RepID=A0A484M5L2_9ASTE|nr:unnamed protein product [Cuscuta campestris]
MGETPGTVVGINRRAATAPSPPLSEPIHCPNPALCPDLLLPGRHCHRTPRGTTAVNRGRWKTSGSTPSPVQLLLIGTTRCPDSVAGARRLLIHQPGHHHRRDRWSRERDLRNLPMLPNAIGGRRDCCSGLIRRRQP